jgi:hypothetical protein
VRHRLTQSLAGFAGDDSTSAGTAYGSALWINFDDVVGLPGGGQRPQVQLRGTLDINSSRSAWTASALGFPCEKAYQRLDLIGEQCVRIFSGPRSPPWQRSQPVTLRLAGQEI